MTENYALRDISRTFPVGQIILSQQYDVVYHNDIAAQAFESLAQLDIAQFKYYFINELLEETLFEKVEASAFFEKNDWLIKVSKEYHEINYDFDLDQFNYVIYIMHKQITPQAKKRDGRYFERLTAREKEIAILMRQGLSNKEISARLSISPFTVKTHIQHIYEKGEGKNRVHLLNNLFKK